MATAAHASGVRATLRRNRWPILAATLTIGALLALVLVVLPASEEEPPPRGLGAAELAWVRKYSGWWGATWGAVWRAFGVANEIDPDRASGAFEQLPECAASFSRRVGAPPDGPLERVVEHATLACEAAAEAAAAPPDLAPYSERRLAIVRAIDELTRADERLGDLLVMERPLPRAGGLVAFSRVEPRLSEAATELTGRPAEVRCWSRRDWRALRRETAALGGERAEHYIGIVYLYRGAAHLSPEECRVLTRLAYADEAPVAGAAAETLTRALTTLATKTEFMLGDQDEQTIACYAMQEVRTLARRLGASRRAASAFAVRALRAYERELDPALRSPKCRNGGALDLAPENPVWP